MATQFKKMPQPVQQQLLPMYQNLGQSAMQQFQTQQMQQQAQQQVQMDMLRQQARDNAQQQIFNQEVV